MLHFLKGWQRWLRALGGCGLLFGLVGGQAAGGPPAGLRGALIVNEDNSHFFGSRPAEAMTRQGVEALIDGYAGSAVTHLFLNPNSMRTSYRSAVRDAIWEPVNGVVPTGLWPLNAQRLDAAGLDPYAIWIARSRHHGISPWISMRMNDVHAADDPESFLHSEFWRRHPELRRVPGGPAVPWVSQALNYAHPAVRAHQLDLVRELLERYDADGLELDWMRFGFHLTPGTRAGGKGNTVRGGAGGPAADRGLGQAAGHPIRLGVRVPAHPDAAAGLGMDAIDWARRGWVDLIVPCPFWSTSDFDIPVELWRERLGERSGDVVVAPGFEHNLRPSPQAKPVANDLATLRGFAASARQRGAETLYLFNWMDSQTRPVSAEDYTVLIKKGLADTALAGAPRRHPLTYRDTVPAGFPNGVQLPVELKGKTSVTLQATRRAGDRSASVVIGLAGREGVEQTQLRVRLNGRELPPGEPLASLTGLSAVTRALQFRCSLEEVLNGANTVTLEPLHPPAVQEVSWVEIRVNID
jgi:hypothetical protein